MSILPYSCTKIWEYTQENVTSFLILCNNSLKKSTSDLEIFDQDYQKDAVNIFKAALTEVCQNQCHSSWYKIINSRNASVR